MRARLRSACVSVCLVLELVASASFSAAQTVTGSVQGVVSDAGGGVLPGASVVVKSVDTGQQRVTTTNDQGFYQVPFLPLGIYQVTTSLPGFTTVARENIDVTLNTTRVVDFKLSPAAVAETISVSADAPPINTTNQEIKSSLNAEQIIEKPTLNPGSFLTLAETFAGFQENPTSGQNNPTASSGSSINFNGTGTRGATFQINGVNNDDSSENQNRQGAALSTIKEFQVIQNTYSAEFGRGYGAVVLVQTKAGTNQIRGDVYDYHQDSQWNARSFFALAKPNNSRDQYGGTVGLPIKRDRLFAFMAFDRTRSSGTNTYSRDILLPNERTPTLSRDNDTPANREFVNSLIARFPSSLSPNDPRTIRAFSGTQPFSFPDQDYSTRLDLNVGQGSTLTARYQYTRQHREADDVILGEATKQNNKQANVGVTWTHVMTPRVVGEARYGLGLRSTNVDIAAGNNTPVVRFVGSLLTSTIGSAGNFPIHRTQKDNQFVYNLTALMGHGHSFKVGTDIRRQLLDDLADSFSRGFYNFSATCGGVTYSSAYAAMLDGCISTYQRGYGPFFLENRINEYNAYVEDSWRVRSDLTLNLGVRYELVQAPYDIQDRIDYAFGDDGNNIEARLGAAWSPSWNSGFLGWVTGGPGNASIRGGYGAYDGRIFQSVFSQTGAGIRFNPPNAANLTFTNQLNISDPTLGFSFVPGVPTARVSITIPDPNLEMPRTHQWNVTLERKVAFNSSVRLSYTGTRGSGFLRYEQQNLPVSPLSGGIRVVDHPFNAPAAGAPDLRGVLIDRIAADVQCAGTGFIPGVNPNAACPNAVPLANNEISFRVPRANERRPDPRYTTNLFVSNDADSWYHGLQVEWIRRLKNGIRFETAYTWSKAIDTTSEATFVGTGDSNQLGPDKRFRRGFSRFHTPHRLTVNGSWLLPLFKNRDDLIGHALGGWQLAGVLKLIGGTPFTVIDTGRDLNFDGFSENRPVVLDPSVLFRSVDNPNISRQQLPREPFRSATLEDFGGHVLGRNTFFMDGVNNLDLGVYKTFQMPSAGQRLNVRFEVFNVFNVPQFGFPNPDLSVATFGSLVLTHTTYRPRTFQIAARFTF